jgi:hypothetical protein
MTTFKIPTTPEAQSFYIALAGVIYKLSLTWNTFSDTWTLDIYSENDILLISGIAVVADIDLLAPYSDLYFGGQLIAKNETIYGQKPTYDDLGIKSNLYFITP